MSLEKSWTNIDKTGWGYGPWMNERDKIQWVDDATDLDCLMVRVPDTGHWCGYVGVAEGHPFFEKEYGAKVKQPEWYAETKCDQLSPMQLFCAAGMYESGEARIEYLLNCHGGITFTDFCREVVEEGRGICHVPAPGRPDKVWWFGFDCLHAWDIAPKRAAEERERGYGPSHDSFYRDEPYVKSQVTKLAAQLHALRNVAFEFVPQKEDE